MHLGQLFSGLFLIGSSTSIYLIPPHGLRDLVARGPSVLPSITSISFSGNGCPQNDPPTVLNPSFISPLFRLPSAFRASTPGSVTDKTRNCQAHLQATGASPGWQVALSDVWVKGHAILEQGATLSSYLTVYFSQDAADTTTIHQSVISEGERSEKDITLHSRVPPANLVWSPCTDENGSIGILNVNFRVAFTSNTTSAQGYFGASGNSSATERWGWAWRSC